MAENDDARENEEKEHKFMLRIDKFLWERFTEKLPVGISANEKIISLIRDWVLEYEYIIGEKNDENTKKR